MECLPTFPFPPANDTPVSFASLCLPHPIALAFSQPARCIFIDGLIYIYTYAYTYPCVEAFANERRRSSSTGRRGHFSDNRVSRFVSNERLTVSERDVSPRKRVEISKPRKKDKAERKRVRARSPEREKSIFPRFLWLDRRERCKSGGVIDGACRILRGEQRRKRQQREAGVGCQFPRARDSSQKGSRVWLRSYGGHRRAYIAAMLSANTRVRPIYPKG